jgi:BMFP domain-containing protein YqiC
MALPFLESMGSPFARASVAPVPRRMFCICNNLGVLPRPFFPSDAGRAYTPSPYLKLLEEHRADFTVLSGVSHPNVDGGHPSDISFLTAAPHPASSSFRNTISLDQLVAERIGMQTRFPSLTLAVNGGRGLSWTRTGVAIPPEGQASGVFKQLFLQGTPDEIERQIRDLDTGRSILDVVSEQARDLRRNVGARDRTRLDQYYSSVRDLEHRLQESRGWANKPKPTVKASPPIDPASPAQYMAKVQVMYDLARLAFETDSTRAITLMLNSVGTPVVQIAGATITDSYHNLSHHGMAEEKLTQLKAIDEWHMKLLADLFKGLKSAREDGQALLDRTMVLYGSNLGDANAHSTTNLPTLIAGGGFRHGQHLAFDRGRNYPLPNLFVSMLQRMGIEEAGFGPSTGTMRGLEMD